MLKLSQRQRKEIEDQIESVRDQHKQVQEQLNNDPIVVQYRIFMAKLDATIETLQSLLDEPDDQSPDELNGTMATQPELEEETA